MVRPIPFDRVLNIYYLYVTSLAIAYVYVSTKTFLLLRTEVANVYRHLFTHVSRPARSV